MNAISLCGIALISFAAIEILGKEHGSLGLLIGLAGTLCLFAPAVLSLTGAFGTVMEKIEKYDFFGAETLMRSFGIGLCCEITGDICRDSGKQSIANALDFSCKTAILLLCIPLWEQLFDTIGGLLP